MRFGMPTLVEHMDLEKDARLCSKLGLSFVEINMSFLPFQAEQLSRTEWLRSLSQQYGIGFTIHLDENMEIGHFNPAVRKAHLDTVLQVIRLAGEAGIPLLNMHLHDGVFVTLPEKRVYLLESFEEDYRQFLLEFREACSRAAQGLPLHIAIENTGGYPPFQQRAVDLLLEDSLFSLTWDIGHSHVSGDVDEGFLRRRQNRLRHFHIHDAVRGAQKSQDHLALGDGEIDLIERLELARRLNCSCVLETKTVQALTASVEWVRERGLGS